MREIKFQAYNTRPNSTSFKKGHKKIGGFIKGSKHPEISEKVSKSLLGKTGEEARNWQGGKTKIRLLIPNLSQYIVWRTRVFERDNWTCQTCHNRRCYLEAHHLKRLSDIIDEYQLKTSQDCLGCLKLWDINNGVTLCKNCHNLTKGRRKNVK
jgi:hypothetical protein